MPGTIAGGKAAAATNKLKYGPDFYAKIGAIGGKLGRTGGFFVNRELARVAGSKGGKVSRRPPRFCSIEGCGAKHAARGLCRHHYMQLPESRIRMRQAGHRYYLKRKAHAAE